MFEEPSASIAVGLAALAAATVAASTPGVLGIAERSRAMTNVARQTASDTTAIRPFRVNFAEAELDRIAQAHKRDQVA